MKKIFFLLTILLSPFWVFSQQAVIEKLTDIAQITFPCTPNPKSSKTNDSGFAVNYQANIYVVQVHDFSTDSTFSLDSTNLANKYKELIDGVVEFSNGKLLNTRNILISGLKGVEIKFSAKFYDSTYTCYQRILYVNRTIYNYGFWTKRDSENDIMIKKNNFFDSFKITKNKKGLFQYYVKPKIVDFWSTKLGSIIGGVLKCIIVFVLLYYIAKGFPFQAKNKRI